MAQKMVLSPLNQDSKEIELWDRVASETLIVLSPGILPVCLQGDDKEANHALSLATSIAVNLADRMVALRRERTNLIELPRLV